MLPRVPRTADDLKEVDISKRYKVPSSQETFLTGSGSECCVGSQAIVAQCQAAIVDYGTMGPSQCAPMLLDKL